MKYIYIQGNFAEEQNAAISVQSRAFRFGDGVFETIRVENGGLYNLQFHLSRLQSGLDAIKLPVSAAGYEAALKEIIARNHLQKGFARISISRGEGSKGWQPTSNNPFTVIETIDGIEEPTAIATYIISSKTAHVLAPAKTMNGLLYTLALIEAKEQGADNAIILDGDGNICETANGNLFWYKGGKLYTPAATLPLIPGSIRERVIKLHGAEEVISRISALENADEIFMTNVNCLVQPLTKQALKAEQIRNIIKDDIRTSLG